MSQVKQGDTVQLHYTGRLQNGVVFDTSRVRQPLQFTVGKGLVIDGFDQAVIGMTVGQSKTAVIPMEQAYGPRREELVVTMQRSQLPAGLDPKVGQRLEFTQTDDKVVLATVLAETDSTLTVDTNHPLAGNVLTFDIELINII